MMTLTETNWYQGLPADVQQAVKDHPPGRYRLRPCGCTVEILAWGIGTCNVRVCEACNAPTNEKHTVMGVKFEDLESVQ